MTVLVDTVLVDTVHVDTVLVDVAGWLGAAALVLAYAQVSSGRLRSDSTGFQALNLGGAAGLLANGVHHGAWPSAALNGVWLSIGVVALVRLRRGRPPREAQVRRR